MQKMMNKCENLQKGRTNRNRTITEYYFEITKRSCYYDVWNVC